jgi:hypothetical protein
MYDNPAHFHECAGFSYTELQTGLVLASILEQTIIEKDRLKQAFFPVVNGFHWGLGTSNFRHDSCFLSNGSQCKRLTVN